ncbi:choice-of-anchor B family protein [Phaeodactylibacter luteus]|uniref:Choice-of-anchor B family protein n=1 Tax=Phaeodactylibacter luteus TaxID=1564516 RepID=A0A5C6RHK6_9BACT|nr:choice-of-anchor B family protein [Phaeodactylibacter luteus]TXB61504.1 choice-of-anchor B family protein [Phaeodactylibacter luteus]
MKPILLPVLLLLLSCTLFAQQEANLLSTWSDPTLVGSNAYDNTYNEVWGLAVNGYEYAVIGSTAGTHFIDVTDPESPFEAHFVAGAAQGGGIIHRDYHDYQGYLYAVCDEGPSTLQIMDITQLPDTVIVAYDAPTRIQTAHNIFIDTATAKLYGFAVNGGPQNYSAMRVYDISDPLDLNYLGEYNNFGGLIAGHVHDGYVRDDIAFLNCGGAGFAMVDFSDPANPETISTITDYPFRGYNHSGWLTDDGSHYFMADENHAFDIKVFDVSNPCEPELANTFDAEVSNPNSITHNQIVACDYLYVSYYYDGMVVYDISDPANPQKALYYDTSDEPNGTSYKGAWGIYPFLPSGNILVVDMQEGLFVFESVGDNCAATQELQPVNLDCLLPVSVQEEAPEAGHLLVYPQPASGQLQVELNMSRPQAGAQFALYGLHGQLVQQFGPQDLAAGAQTLAFPLQAHPQGLYVLRVQGEQWSHSAKVILK